MIGTVGASLVLILTFDLCYWPRAPETLVISWVTGVSFVLGRQLWVSSWVAPGWGLDMKKTNLWLDAWNFQFHIPFSWKWRRAENGINDWSCLWAEAAMKSQKYGVQRASGLIHVELLGECNTWTGHCKLHASSHIPCPICLFHPHVHLYPLPYPLKNR